MKALTLWRPWPYAIFRLPPDVAKRVANRRRMPPASLIGQRIAIHAGARWDDHGEHSVCAALERHDLLRGVHELRSAGIIGTVRVVGCITDEGIQRGLAARKPPGTLDPIGAVWMGTVHDWWVGPYGWLLDDVRACPVPIPCKGRQGLWDVPPELVGRLP